MYGDGKLGRKVLFVCPTDRLAPNNIANCATLNESFVVAMQDVEVVAKFDDSAYDAIVL